MQLVQDLREDLRVGRDPRAEDSQERVRALRRLRAALPRSAEVPALDHPQTQRQQVRLDARLTVLRIADCGLRIRSPQSATAIRATARSLAARAARTCLSTPTTRAPGLSLIRSHPRHAAAVRSAPSPSPAPG